VKKYGQKIEAERNYNQCVFASLEVGDVIFIQYRKEIFTGGKLSNEIMNEKIFSSFSPSRREYYKVIVPKTLKPNIIPFNLDTSYVTYEIDDFICHEYTFSKMPKVKHEPHMPHLSEIGKGVNVSTIENWSTISDWYHDIALPVAKFDYNLSDTYQEIFEKDKDYTDYEKAKAIYEYICNNINYSHVSFRQSNFTPQRPMVTLSTHLGDCKDVSTLYFTLAREAGLKTNLVLVSTRRGNGENSLKVPSIDFNHCIIRIDLDISVLFQDLTNSYLPFGSIPSSLRNSQALIIPSNESEDFGKELTRIPNTPIIKNTLKRHSTVTVKENKLFRLSSKISMI
jgi:hypothetical protein